MESQGVKFLIGIRESGHYYDEFGNSRADFFEPGSRIPLPRSPGADFFETGSRNPPGAAFGGAPRALRALGRGIS